MPLRLHSTVSVFYVGLDVSSTDCWAALPGRKPRRFLLSAGGAAELNLWIRESAPEHQVLRAVMEHTGVYSLAWAALLRPLGIECVLCNPGPIRSFAKAQGHRSKTDKADAKAILGYALFKEPAETVYSESQQQLDLLCRQRDKVIKQRVAVENQLKALSYLPEQLAMVHKELQRIADVLRECECSLSAKIETLMTEDDRIRTADAVLQNLNGIGPVTSACLCSILDRVLDCNPKQLTALAGLAPSHHESGTSVRGRSHLDKKGRPRLRKCLYMAAMSAARCNDKIKDVKLRLEANGKKGKLLICALARHLLLLAQKALKSEFASPTPTTS